jgi:hypothetical protein
LEAAVNCERQGFGDAGDSTALASSISYSRFARTAFTTLRLPLRQKI